MCFVTMGVRADDLQLLKVNGIGESRQQILSYIQSFAPAKDTDQRIAELIHDLGANAFQVREDAQKELVRIGTRAIPFLEARKNSPDPEIAMRIKRALAELRKKPQLDLLAAAVRVASKEADRQVLRAILSVAPAVRNQIENTIFEAVRAVVSKDDFEFLYGRLAVAPPNDGPLLLFGIAACDHEKTAEAMMAHINNKNEAMRFEVAIYLANRGDGRCLDVFVGLLKSTDEALAMLAESALIQLCDNRFDDNRPDGANTYQQWQQWLDKHGDQLKLKFPIERMAFSLTGTKWKVTHSGVNLKPAIWEFREGGVLHSPSHPKNVNSWQVQGNTVIIRYNNKYVNYTGKMVGPSVVAGNALNVRNTGWTWKMVRLEKSP